MLNGPFSVMNLRILPHIGLSIVYFKRERRQLGSLKRGEMSDLLVKSCLILLH
jgi:hypothetical protein